MDESPAAQSRVESDEFRVVERPVGSRGPRPASRPTERVRTAVLDAARELIDEGGFFNLTVDGLVSRSAVGKATIYRWWENRAAVALDVLFEYYALPGTPHEGSARRRLTAAVAAEVAYLGTSAGPVVAGLVADAQRHPSRAVTFRRRYLDPRHRLLVQLAALVRGEEGLQREAEEVADLLESSLYGRLLLRPDSLDGAWAQHLCEVVFEPDGVRSSSDPEERS